MAAPLAAPSPPWPLTPGARMSSQEDVLPVYPRRRRAQGRRRVQRRVAAGLTGWPGRAGGPSGGLPQGGDALPDADAHGGRRPPGPPPAELVQQRGGDPRARAAERVAYRDGPAVD